MKAKLLRKVRKRYKIVYYPKQVTIYDNTFKGQCMLLIDTQNNYRCHRGVEICSPTDYQKWFELHCQTKEEAKHLLLNRLSEWIKDDYKEYRTRKIKQNIETIWYNDKNNT